MYIFINKLERDIYGMELERHVLFSLSLVH